jgi:hypothetical protein
MAIYNLSKLFQSVTLSSFYFNNLINVLDLPEKSKSIPVLKTSITSDELTQITKFLSALGVSIDDVDNFGIAKFDNCQLQNYSTAFFSLNESGEMGLIIGVDKEEFELTSTFIPTTYDDGCYRIGGKLLELNEQLDDNGVPTGKVYMSLKVNARDTYTFPVVLKSDFKNNGDKLFQFWEDGKFLDAVAQGGKGGNMQFGGINKLFRSAFSNNLFPSEGVYILMESGKYTFSEKSPQYANGIELSNWKVLASSHPELMVDIEVDKTLVSGYFLSEISYISFPKSGQPTKFFMDKEVIGYNEKGAIKKLWDGKVLLWITGINSYTKNPEHIPSHVFIDNPENFFHVPFTNFSEFTKIVASAISGNKNTNTQKALVPNDGVIDIQASNVKELEIANASLPQEYPKSAKPSTGRPSTGRKTKRQPTQEEIEALDSF